MKKLNYTFWARLMGLGRDTMNHAEHFYAYRKGKSTITCLVKSKGRVVKAVCVVCFLLAETVREKNVPSNIYYWTLRFLEYKELKLDEWSCSINSGLPQWSVLSPVLFDLYITSLHPKLNDSTDIYQYADDFIILDKGTGDDQVYRLLQKQFDFFVNKYNTMELPVNSSVISLRRNNGKPRKILVHQSPLKKVPELSPGHHCWAGQLWNPYPWKITSIIQS